MEVRISVPESLGDIKLKDYQKFLKIQNDNENDHFIRQKMIELFCNVPGTLVLKMSHKDFMQVSNHLIKILMEQPDFRPTFKMGGVEYGFIPNMKRDIQVQEYIDIDSYLGETDNLHKTMGVFYRPITVKKKGKYQIEEYDAGKYDDAMKEAPMDVVAGALVFFYRLGRTLLTITPKYLERAVERNRKVLDSVENGDGISTSTNLLGETSSTLMKLLSANLERHCFSLRMTGTLTKK